MIDTCASLRQLSMHKTAKISQTRNSQSFQKLTSSQNPRQTQLIHSWSQSLWRS